MTGIDVRHYEQHQQVGQEVQLAAGTHWLPGGHTEEKRRAPLAVP
ncbi:hypothetical protein [Streptomyces niveus]|nr:hypothetical protein [Streptomyces niveus]